MKKDQSRSAYRVWFDRWRVKVKNNSEFLRPDIVVVRPVIVTERKATLPADWFLDELGNPTRLIGG